MAKNRMVNTRIRSDGRVLDLDPSEKLLRIYLITNDHTDLCGIYEIHTRVICMETWFDKDMVNKIIDRFQKEWKVKRFENRIHIINFAKHQIKNPSVQKGIERSLNLIPKQIIDSLSTEWVQSDTLNLDLTKPNLDLDLNSNYTEEIEEKIVIPNEINIFFDKQKENMISIASQINSKPDYIYKQAIEYEGLKKEVLAVWDPNVLCPAILEFIYNDDFRKNNIGSITKLRKKNPDGIKYWIVMLEKYKQWQSKKRSFIY